VSGELGSVAAKSGVAVRGGESGIAEGVGHEVAAALIDLVLKLAHEHGQGIGRGCRPGAYTAAAGRRGGVSWAHRKSLSGGPRCDVARA